jgi:hypothetical protein
MHWGDPWEAAPQLRDGERLTDQASAGRAPAFGVLPMPRYILLAQHSRPL